MFLETNNTKKMLVVIIHLPKWGSLSFVSCCALLFCLLLVSKIHKLDYKLAILKHVQSLVASASH